LEEEEVNVRELLYTPWEMGFGGSHEKQRGRSKIRRGREKRTARAPLGYSFREEREKEKN